MSRILTCLLCLVSSGIAAPEEDRVFSTSDRLLLGTESQRSAAVRLGDVDGDRDLDVVVANGRHWPQQNFVFFNQGRARFNLARPLGRDLATSYAAELADLDGDGDLDVAVGNDKAPNAVFLNDGHGQFAYHGTFGEPASIRSLALADIDLDGDVDIVANARGQQNRIYLNDGAANFPTSLPFGSADDSTIDVAVADLDDDGDLDLLLANRDAQQNVVLLNDGESRFEQRLPFGTGSDETRAVAAADLDGDGNLDWVVGSIEQPNAIYFADGRGGVREARPFGRADGRTYALAIADMDDDGQLDIVVGNAAQPNAVFFLQGAGSALREVRFGDPTEATYSLAVGDLDQDGHADIAVANSDGRNRVYLNRPDRPSDDAQNWPQFRGPGGAGVAEGYPLRTSWNADPAAEAPEGVLWRAPVPGLGHSSPVVWGGRVFVCTAVPKDGEAPLKLGAGGQPTAADDSQEHRWVVLCFDKDTGEELWRATAHEGRPRTTRHVKATQANTTLAVDGEHLVAFFGSEGLYCYDLEGALQWKRDLGVIDISKYDIGWGYSSSPAIHGDRIALVCDDPSNPYLVVLRLSDGEELWRVSREGVSERSWGTPLIHEGAETTQVVVNGWPWVVSYDLESGEVLWRIEGGGDNPIPTPFVANGRIYVSSAHGRLSPVYVVRPEARGIITPSNREPSNDGVVWSTFKGGSYMSTPVVYRGHVYLGSSSIVRCFDAETGESVYAERLDGASIIASLVAADGKVYCASEEGNVFVLAAGPEFRVLATNPMGEPCFATPAISQGTLYFRTTKSLVAIK